jgi:pimeloyl-ACP methyl ester carboxylesterase
VPLRKYLDSLGYATEGWNQGLNLGPRPGVLETARQQITDTFHQSGRKVSLIGWSLGGIYARELAKMLPEMVHCVITLGTPFAGSPKSTNAWRIYEFASGRKTEIERSNFDLPSAPTVLQDRWCGGLARQYSSALPCESAHREYRSLRQPRWHGAEPQRLVGGGGQAVTKARQLEAVCCA